MFHDPSDYFLTNLQHYLRERVDHSIRFKKISSDKKEWKAFLQ